MPHFEISRLQRVGNRALVARPDRIEFERGVTLFEVLVTSACIAILALIIGANLPQARAQTQVSACETNLRSIATAAEQYYSALQAYPASGNVTSTLFQNPNASTVTYLGTTPVDPADPTRTAPYVYTYTAPTATAAGFYVIQCPGIHSKDTLGSLPGATGETTGTILLDSTKNLYTE